MTLPFYFSLVTLGFTWALLVVGGLVNPMGASMACPDWYFFPTCNGEVLPDMVGGVLYEHGHRMLASFVGLLTVVLAGLNFFYKVDSLTKKLSLFAVLLVIIQGCLGGITVLFHLSAWVSTLHLTFAMIFFSTLIYISFRLSPRFSPHAFSMEKSFLVAIFLTIIQIIYGGIVRHVGAGLACGDDIFTCGKGFWPSWSYGQIHMGHRLLGYALSFVIMYVAARSRAMALRKHDHFLAKLSLLPVAIVLLQIGLGLLAIYTHRSPVILALHTGFGALLLACLLCTYFFHLPRREETPLFRWP